MGRFKMEEMLQKKDELYPKYNAHPMELMKLKQMRKSKNEENQIIEEIQAIEEDGGNGEN